MKYTILIGVLSLGLFGTAWAQNNTLNVNGKLSLSKNQNKSIHLDVSKNFSEFSHNKLEKEDAKKALVNESAKSLKNFIQAEGGVVNGGGGDSCEDRIQEIRDDITAWIQKGGHNYLKNLPISTGEYAKRMLSYLNVEKQLDGSIRPTTHIECVHHPVDVQGVEKTCRFDLFTAGAQITCYAEGFLDKKTMGADEQYRLIHHEYAGLANLEVPSASQSTYPISDQLSAFLENQVVKKLAVKPVSPPQTGPPSFKISDIKEGNYRLDLPIAQTQWDRLACGFYVQTDVANHEISITYVANPAFPSQCDNEGKMVVLTCASDEAKDCVAQNIDMREGSFSPFDSTSPDGNYSVDYSFNAKPGQAFNLQMLLKDPKSGNSTQKNRRYIFDHVGSPQAPQYFTGWNVFMVDGGSMQQACSGVKKYVQPGVLATCQGYSNNCSVFKEVTRPDWSMCYYYLMYKAN